MKDNNKLGKMFILISIILVIITGCLSLWNDAFISSLLLMISLCLFSLCFYKKDNKKLLYFLFIFGIFFIIGSLIYTIMRII